MAVTVPGVAIRPPKLILEAVVLASNMFVPAEFWTWNAVVELAASVKVDNPSAVRVPADISNCSSTSSSYTHYLTNERVAPA